MVVSGEAIAISLRILGAIAIIAIGKTGNGAAILRVRSWLGVGDPGGAQLGTREAVLFPVTRGARHEAVARELGAVEELHPLALPAVAASSCRLLPLLG